MIINTNSYYFSSHPTSSLNKTERLIHRSYKTVFTALFIVLVLSGCEKVERIKEKLSKNPHRAYAESLDKSGLDESELGKRWLDAARTSLQTPLLIEIPYEEIGWSNPSEIQAHAWRFSVKKGRRIKIELETPEENRGDIFLDMFEVETSGNRDHVSSLKEEKEEEAVIEYSVDKDADYVLRLQPEIMAAGRYKLKIESLPSITFPVAGKSASAIGGSFGDPRDGGKRRHKGVDIFAPRSTRVLAAVNGIVTRTENTPIGGNVVWLRGSGFGRVYYYAHLDRVSVKTGSLVKTGDILGYIGNTGNAKSTSRHLHFGIYETFEGPADPLPFILPPKKTAGKTTVPTEDIKSVYRVARNGLRLRRNPDTGSSVITEL